MKTILVLDDDPQFRRLLAELFAADGHVIVEATTSAEADAALLSCTPDLLVVDGSLRDVDGAVWLRRYRAAGGRSPAVFVSSFWRGPADLATESIHLVVSKPVIPETLRNQVNELLASPIVDPGPRDLSG